MAKCHPEEAMSPEAPAEGDIDYRGVTFRHATLHTGFHFLSHTESPRRETPPLYIFSTFSHSLV